MWWELVIDVLWPGGGRKSTERSVEKADSGTLAVEFRVPGEFKRRLNESGWLADEVIAAGMLRQGKSPSLLAMITGWALIEVLRPRRSKSLPREFALALTADRVVIFAMSRWSEGDGETEYVVKVKRDERGSWRRELVRLTDLPGGGDSTDRMVELAGMEPFPVTWNGDQSADELIELLSR
jgi:hypothetical protein